MAEKSIYTDRDVKKLLKAKGVEIPEVPKELKEEPKEEPLLVQREKLIKKTIAQIESELYEEYVEPPKQDKYTPLAFLHPMELLEFFDPVIKSGLITPHDWQYEECLRVAKPCWTKANPYLYTLLANNGSGKDSYFNAPLAVWNLTCNIRSRTIITSASASQLKYQTEAYIRAQCVTINQSVIDAGGKPPISIKRGHITCTLTGSEIILFKTDEGGRAEGYHPFPDYPLGKLIILVNEGKSVEPMIYDHLGKCSYSIFADISSAGSPSGKFYEHYRNAVKYPEELQPGKRYARKVTSYDCPHVSKRRIEQDKAEHGEASVFFKATHLSEFYESDNSTIVSQVQLETCLEKAVDKHIPIGKFAGVDISRGGDEATFYAFDGNCQIAEEHFRIRDTEVTKGHIILLIDKHQVPPDKVVIDDGNVGAAIIDGLRKLKYYVQHLTNQSQAINNRLYANRIAECWFKFARLVDAGVIVLNKNNTKLHSEIISRRFSSHLTSGKIKLEAKEDIRARGGESPNRADAVVNAFSQWSLETFGVKARPEVGDTIGEKPIPTTLDLARQMAKTPTVSSNIFQSMIPEPNVNRVSRNAFSILRNLYGRHK